MGCAACRLRLINSQIYRGCPKTSSWPPPYPRTILPCISKPEFITLKIQQALTEGDGFDLLVMGRQEGPGCYCYVNNLLRTIIDNIAQKYSVVVIDNEAGMEHLSRRTTRNVDVMFVLSDPTRTGITTALRIKKLAEEMKLGVGKFVLVVNWAGNLPESLRSLAAEGGFASSSSYPRTNRSTR